MRSGLKSILFGALAAVLLTTAVAADDWAADKLRGRVLQLVDGRWQPLNRGMIIPDDRVVRTLAMGYVTLTRGQETLELGPNTQIQIFDKAGKKPFTTVKQAFGTVSVEAEVRNVQHFAVDTPYLAAVVKGTRFTVTSGKTKSTVSVRRGHVAVEDLANNSHVTLSVGQSAIVDGIKTKSIVVEGRGTLPTVVDDHGKPVASETKPSGKKTMGEKSADVVRISAGKSGVSVNVPGLGIGLGLGNSGQGSNGSGNGSDGKGSNNGKGSSGDNGGNGGNSGSGSGNSGNGQHLSVNVVGIHLGL